jgi:hypothetical protein
MALWWLELTVFLSSFVFGAVGLTTLVARDVEGPPAPQTLLAVSVTRIVEPTSRAVSV